MKHKLQWGTSSDAILLMLIRLVTILLSFVVTRLLSEYLTVYDYGTYSQILLVVSTVTSLTILGMVDGVNFFYCSERDPEKRESYIATIFTLQCLVSAVAGCIVMALSGPLCRYFGNPDVKRLLIFAAILPMLQNLISMLQVLLVSVGKARMLAMRNLVVAVLRLAVVLLVITAVRDVAAILLTTVLLDALQVAFFVYILGRNDCRIHLKRVKMPLVRNILSYCAPMAVFLSVQTINRDIDKYLVALLTDSETLAIYSNASKVLPFNIIMSSFTTVLVPEITRMISVGDLKEARTLYKVFLEICYVSTAILCCAALAAAPQLMRLLYSEKYLGGLTVFCIYILVDLLQFSNITLILSAVGKTKTLMAMGLGSLGMNAVLNVVLYRWMGLPGPAVATLLTTVVMGVLLLCLGAKELQTDLGGLFDGKFLLLFTCESLLAVFLCSGLRQWLDSLGMRYFVTLVLVCGVYGAVFLLLHGKRLMKDMKQINRATKKTE